METTRLSTKGQIVLPKSIRIARDWKPGTELTVEESGDSVILRATKRLPHTSLDEVYGCLRSKRRATIAEMKGAIVREIRRRHDRGRY